MQLKLFGGFSVPENRLCSKGWELLSPLLVNLFRNICIVKEELWVQPKVDCFGVKRLLLLYLFLFSKSRWSNRNTEISSLILERPIRNAQNPDCPIGDQSEGERGQKVLEIFPLSSEVCPVMSLLTNRGREKGRGGERWFFWPTRVQSGVVPSLGRTYDVILWQPIGGWRV